MKLTERIGRVWKAITTNVRFQDEPPFPLSTLERWKRDNVMTPQLQEQMMIALGLVSDPYQGCLLPEKREGHKWEEADIEKFMKFPGFKGSDKRCEFCGSWLKWTGGKKYESPRNR